MVFNATFNNISVILLRSVLLKGGNWSTQKKPQPCRKLLTNLSHNVVSSTPRQSEIRSHNVSDDRH